MVRAFGSYPKDLWFESTFTHIFLPVVQLVECVFWGHEVVGSSPGGPIKKSTSFEVLFFIFGFYNVWRTQTKLSKGFKWNTPWPTVLQAFINLSDFQNFLKCKPNVNSAIKILGGLNRLSHFQKINKIKKQSTIL